MLRSEGMNVSDNSWVSKVEEGVIDGDTTSGRGMKNGELCVLDSSSEEVCNGVCSSVKGDGVEGRILRSSPLKMYSVANVLVPDVPCDFFFVILVDKDERVVLWISRIILDPILTWVVSLVLAVSG